jgi:pimeloyl-ACP methyl ester carboxylesterase
MNLKQRMISTPYANLAVLESHGAGLPLILIHGNSNSSAVFRHQLNSDLAERYRLIAVDLPGHGGSTDAFDPHRTYSIPGYAATIEALIDALSLERVAILGWSLGGHIALELIPDEPRLVGTMIVGAPPVGNDLASIQKGFHETPALYLAGKEELSEQEVQSFVDLTLAELADSEIMKAVRRSHGLARRLSFEALLAGKAADERRIVETSNTPVAVVNGERDRIVNLDYVASIRFKKLWQQHCFVLRGLGHAPFLEAPHTFNPILARFLKELETLAAAAPARLITRGAA